MHISSRLVFIAVLAVPFAASAQEAPSCHSFACVDGTMEENCEYLGEPCLQHGGIFGPFADVSSAHPNAEAIEYVKAEGIVEGYADGTFKPDATINRAEFVKILMGSLEDDGRMCKIAPFTDIDQTAWYATYAHKARCQGIVEGYPDGTFKPAASINFAEAAKILANSYELPFDTTDVWYEGYVRGIEQKNAIPTSITRFDQNITRGEMADMIYRLETGNKVPVPRSYEDIERGSKTFDGCGDVSSYANRPWFKDFAEQARKNGFDTAYSEGFSEGCLALDGSLFMAIYSGGYCDGSTFLLYKPFEKNLDTAGIQWKTEDSCSHNINEFGARSGSHIVLTGGFGDAGCAATYYYDYDLITNIIVKTSAKEWCQDETPVWARYE